ncbi:MAG: hypothetical protein IH582_14370 [Afipia sp.]|jgi:hypothetical protein|nr:hypothetical protein [Afipia sp.]
MEELWYSHYAEFERLAYSGDRLRTTPGKAMANAYLFAMNLSLTQQQAIEARMALIVGAEHYDRLFLGFQCTELEGDSSFSFR